MQCVISRRLLLLPPLPVTMAGIAVALQIGLDGAGLWGEGNPYTFVALSRRLWLKQVIATVALFT